MNRKWSRFCIDSKKVLTWLYSWFVAILVVMLYSIGVAVLGARIVMTDQE